MWAKTEFEAGVRDGDGKTIKIQPSVLVFTLPFFASVRRKNTPHVEFWRSSLAAGESLFGGWAGAELLLKQAGITPEIFNVGEDVFNRNAKRTEQPIHSCSQQSSGLKHLPSLFKLALL